MPRKYLSSVLLLFPRFHNFEHYFCIRDSKAHFLFSDTDQSAKNCRLVKLTLQPFLISIGKGESRSHLAQVGTVLLSKRPHIDIGKNLDTNGSKNRVAGMKSHALAIRLGKILVLSIHIKPSYTTPRRGEVTQFTEFSLSFLILAAVYVGGSRKVLVYLFVYRNSQFDGTATSVSGTDPP